MEDKKESSSQLQRRPPRPKKKPKKPANPLVRGILAFCSHHGIVVTEDEDSHDMNITPTGEGPSGLRLSSRVLSRSDIPKRYSAYASLVLLPANFPTQNPRWAHFYAGLSESERRELFRYIAERGFGETGTGSDRNADEVRIGISAPIAAEEVEQAVVDAPQASTAASSISEPYASESPGVMASGLSYSCTAKDSTVTQRKQNVLRSPSGLVPVYGDWGPLSRIQGSSESSDSVEQDVDRRRVITNPDRRDFEEAFWTSTSQHKGITQCWAPLYTMFSRGNVSEKARILGPQFPGLTTTELGEPLPSIDVVDFYVGIGYFAFCYLARGVRRVWGWDINPWSIEGLRRGCEKNGWGCLVVRVDDYGQLVLTGNENDELRNGDVVKEIVARVRQNDAIDMKYPRQGQQPAIRCIAFLGDNKWSAKVMGDIRRELVHQGLRFNVRHANLGLLPTSRGSWENAVKLIQDREGGRGAGWLHVHENVDVRDIEAMKDQIVQDINRMIHHGLDSDPADGSDIGWSVSCHHIHQVKTYAPGVMHCVFDINITPNG